MSNQTGLEYREPKDPVLLPVKTPIGEALTLVSSQPPRSDDVTNFAVISIKSSATKLNEKSRPFFPVSHSDSAIYVT
jgi:hypothetical protein